MIDILLVARRPLSVRMVLIGTLIALLCTAMWAGQDVNEPFEVGQRWVYKHEGPRPGSIEPNDIDGERIMHVIGVVGEPEGKQWIIEDRFTGEEKATGRIYVNSERLLTALEIKNQKGEAAKLRYDPPIPHQIMELDIGQEKTVETSLKMDSAKFSLLSTIVIRRLDDETITTAAGEFASCQHFKTTSKSIFNIKIAKIPITEERERWYHPKANGLVKEVYRKGPVKFLTWSRAGYTATSVLAAFGKEEVPVEIRLASQNDNTNQSQEPSDHPQPRASSSSAVYVLFLGTIIVLVVGIHILRKRKRRTTQSDSTI